MATVEKSIEIFAPVEDCYRIWTEFEQFPRFMKNVQAVEPTGDPKVWHWVVEGPLGKTVEWDAQLTEMQPNEVVAWQSVRNAEVRNAGEVHFEDLGNNKTRIDVSMSYEPPAGVVGELVADLFKNPEHMVEEDLEQFKRLVTEDTQPRTPYSDPRANSTVLKGNNEDEIEA